MLYAVFSALVYHYSSGIARLRGQTNERMVEVLGKADSIRAMRIFARRDPQGAREGGTLSRRAGQVAGRFLHRPHRHSGPGHPWPHCSHRAGNRCRQKRRADPGIGLRRRRMAGAHYLSRPRFVRHRPYIQRVLVRADGFLRFIGRETERMNFGQRFRIPKRKSFRKIQILPLGESDLPQAHTTGDLFGP